MQIVKQICVAYWQQRSVATHWFSSRTQLTCWSRARPPLHSELSTSCALHRPSRPPRLRASSTAPLPLSNESPFSNAPASPSPASARHSHSRLPELHSHNRLQELHSQSHSRRPELIAESARAGVGGLLPLATPQLQLVFALCVDCVREAPPQ